MQLAGISRLTGFVVVLAVSACSAKSADTEANSSTAARAGVDSAANRLLVGLRTNNSDSLMALMAPDVVMMPPGEPALKGSDAVRAWYNQFLTQLRTSDLTITDREVMMGGDWASEVAGYEWTLQPVGGGQPIVDRGSYIQLWHHEPDGRWLFSREIWNSSIPLAGK